MAGRVPIESVEYREGRRGKGTWSWRKAGRRRRRSKTTPNRRSRQASPWVGRLARLGYVAKGVVYAAIGFLALREVIGVGGRTTDPTGVMHAAAAQPLGGSCSSSSLSASPATLCGRWCRGQQTRTIKGPMPTVSCAASDTWEARRHLQHPRLYRGAVHLRGRRHLGGRSGGERHGHPATVGAYPGRSRRVGCDRGRPLSASTRPTKRNFGTTCDWNR